MSTQEVTPGGLVEASIRLKLTKLLEPATLTVVNDSWKHKHHRAMIDKGGGDGETHFSITIISHAFQGKSLMQRHRMIYSALADELQQGLHALSLVTKTPEELPDAPQ
ncbi:hypothetical protein ACEPAG_8073 [Sanghuangporus baumii]